MIPNQQQREKMKYAIIWVVLVLASCGDSKNATSNMKAEHLRHVGDIVADRNMDDPNFKACQEDRAAVHYNFDSPNLYEGEKPAIVRAFMDMDLPKVKGSLGYVTVRFMVNCKGETGRFRVEQVDTDYKKKTFNTGISDAILATTKSLNGWIPATYDGKVYDYYKYLTFKIIDNQIVDVLP